jgi:SAM-dependent methyltransferase
MPLNSRDAIQQTAPGRDRILRDLDRLAASLQAGSPPPGCVQKTVDLLSDYRRQATPQEWREFAAETIRAHPILAPLHRDPYSSYSFRKPRGYPGDAVLLDFIYGGGGSQPLLDASDDFGRQLFRQAAQSPAFETLRARRDFLARRIEECCAAKSTRILAVACGHLRELLQLPVRCVPERFLAIDQDALSLATAQADLPGLAIETVSTSAFRLLDRRFNIGSFDFIYSAGLYDYLDDDFAVRLLLALSRRLASGGVLLVANMLPGFQPAGYMEAVMDWWLIYRTAEEMASLARPLVASGGFSMRTFNDAGDDIVYLEIRRDGAAPAAAAAGRI